MSDEWLKISEGLGGKIVAELKSIAGDAWDSWSDSERALVVAVSKDAAQLAAKAIAGIDVTAERAQVEAQLAGIKVAGQSTASDVIWVVLEKILLTIANSFIK